MAGTDLGLLLDTGAPEYVIEEHKKLIGSQLEREYNCCVMFYAMKYTEKRLKQLRVNMAFLLLLAALRRM